jgi:hypothetical protein
MNKNSTIEKLFKKELNSEKFEYSENLWNKLDQQLGPIRAAHQKKEKRRAIILWASLLLLIVSGVGIGITTYKNKKTTNPIAQSTVTSTNVASEAVTNDNSTSTTTQKTTNNTITNIEATNNNIIANNITTGATNITTGATNSGNTIENSTTTNASTTPSLVRAVENKRKATKINHKKITDLSSSYNHDKQVSLNQQYPKKSTINNDEMVAEKELTPLTTEKKEATIIAQPTAPTETAKQNNTTEQSNKKKVVTKNTTSFFAAAGINVATPIKKPGYFGGVMMQKQIDDKRIFIGLKLSHNELNHQLISSNKANVFPQITDAIIDKMTVIQMPFGYQFQLNKKAGEKSSLLNVGFEPTLLTGVKTIYYDDFGVVGGPRTAVVNSPLLKNAINKFNLSFIAGIQLPLTNSLSFTLNGGYGLIDITDKQYYNRTIKNNNLKYMQAGVLLRLK